MIDFWSQKYTFIVHDRDYPGGLSDAIQYGKRIQLADPVLPHHQAPKEDIKRCQQIVGTFLFYARAVDPILLPALNTLSETQANPSKDTIKNINQLLDFVATYPNAKIRYKASDMHLWIDSDAAYLVAPNAKSKTVGYFYLSEQPITLL